MYTCCATGYELTGQKIENCQRDPAFEKLILTSSKVSPPSERLQRCAKALFAPQRLSLG